MPVGKDKQKTVTVNIINRNYPPSVGFTGESASELASYLTERGINVNIICVGMRDAQKQPDSPGNVNIFTVKTFYNGKQKLLRLLGSLFEGYNLIRQSKRLGPDVTICLTDPPMLNIWAAYLFGKKDSWILWSMDLYPEAFVASGLISPRNFLYRLLDRAVVSNKPGHIISLGRPQAKYLINKYRTAISYTELPCGIYAYKNPGEEALQNETPAWAGDSDKIYLGYCGNVGEAHSLEFLFAVINNLDAEKHKLILAVYGVNAQKLIDYATGKPGIVIMPSLKKAEMQFLDIHLASLKNNWTHVCVPSKAVSSVCAGAALLYNGDEASDNWQLLQKAGWLISGEDPGTEMRRFFAQLDRETIAAKKSEAVRLAGSLLEIKKQAFEDIYEKLIEKSLKKSTGKESVLWQR